MGIISKLMFWRRRHDDASLDEESLDDPSLNEPPSEMAMPQTEVPPWNEKYDSPTRRDHPQPNFEQNWNQPTPQQSIQGTDIVIAKLDAINAKLDSLNQRLANLERYAAEEDKKPTW